jgi:hypothetical protein
MYAGFDQRIWESVQCEERCRFGFSMHLVFWSINGQVFDKVTVRRWSRLATDDKLEWTGSAAARKRMTWQERADENDRII